MQRALKVVRYLREDGWRPVVLTADPRAYARIHADQLSEIPDDVPVHRAFAIDATRHLSFGGKYPGCFAWPDPWVSWWPTGTWLGKRVIRRYRPDVIWSTFPITTASLIALRLAKWSGLPWIADLRDPMTMDGYPADAMRFRCARWIEQKTVERAARVVFTAEYTRKMYEERYPGLDRKTVLIPNGYDEFNFPELPVPALSSKAKSPLRLVHSGALQPDGRNPGSFFEALAKLKREGRINSNSLQVVFRACGFEGRYRSAAEALDIGDLIVFGPYLPYEQAIEEMVSADGLLVFQGSTFNHAVPAKIYEYFYARRPVFALLDKAGETQRVLREVGIVSIASIDDSDEIARQLAAFIAGLEGGDYRLPPESAIEIYSRRQQTLRLSGLLKAAAAGLNHGNAAR